MRIGNFYEGIELHRKEKIVYAHFQKPHRVLSSCRLNGGLREDLEYVYNHQSCEPANHSGIDLCHVAVREPERYQRRICEKAGIPYGKAASLGTAANMNNAAVVSESFGSLRVVAVTTGGVGSNGARAGDPASYYQSEDGIRMVGKPAPQAGTINMLLFINEEMSAGAIVVAATVMAEAKASVLQELMAPSKYSDALATGTGTDQIGIACLLETRIQHMDSNKHSKLGELIGKTVRASLFEALNLQSGLNPDARRSCIANLQRFGESQEGFVKGVQSYLEVTHHVLLKSNFLAVNHDSVTVASVQALVHVRDQMTWGVVPIGCIQELLVSYAVQIASAVSGRGLGQSAFQEELGGVALNLENKVFLDLVHRAVAHGFTRKWERRFED